MSVDKTSNPPNAYSPVSPQSGAAGRISAEDWQRLQSGFAAAISRSLVRTSSNDRSLLETVDNLQQKPAEYREEQNRQDHRHDVARSVASEQDRGLVNRSETRHSQLSTEYVDRLDHRERIQEEYRHKTEDRAKTVFSDRGLVDAAADSPAINAVVSSTPSASPLPDSGGFGSSLQRSNAFTPGIGSALAASPAGQISLPSAISSSGSSENVFGAGFPSLDSAGTPVVVSQAALPSVPVSTTVSPGVLAAASVLTVFSAASGRPIRDKNGNEEKASSTDKKRPGRTSSSFGAAVLESLRLAEQDSPAPFRPENTGEANRSISESSVFGRQETEEADDPERISRRPGVEEKPEDPPSKPEEDRSNGRQIRSGFSLEEIRAELDGDLSEALPEEWKQAVEEALQARAESNPSSIMPDRASEEASSQEGSSESFDRFRFVQRIAAACQSAARRNGSIRIKLNLDQFGSVTLRILPKGTVQGKRQFDVRFEASTETAARFLAADLESLHESLADHRVVLGEVSISVVAGGETDGESNGKPGTQEAKRSET